MALDIAIPQAAVVLWAWWRKWSPTRGRAVSSTESMSDGILDSIFMASVPSFSLQCMPTLSTVSVSAAGLVSETNWALSAKSTSATRSCRINMPLLIEHAELGVIAGCHSVGYYE